MNGDIKNLEIEFSEIERDLIVKFSNNTNLIDTTLLCVKNTIHLVEFHITTVDFSLINLGEGKRFINVTCFSKYLEGRIEKKVSTPVELEKVLNEIKEGLNHGE